MTFSFEVCTVTLTERQLESTILINGERVTLSVHISSEINPGDVVCWRRFKEDTLPDSTAGRVEDVTWVKSLLSNGDDIVSRVGGIMHEDKPNKSALASMALNAQLTAHCPGPASGTWSRPR